MPLKQQDIEFALFAPYNNAVALVGSWNRWKRIRMKRGDDGWWKLTVAIPDGTYEYRFAVQSKSFFQVDSWVEVADPRGIRLSFDNKNATLVVRRGKRVLTSHIWQHDKQPLPANDALVIYEMHVGDFSGGPGDEKGSGRGQRKGRFVNVEEKLDYLKQLGINAIELMPCNEFPGERSWGYNPLSAFAVENTYGTPDDLCRLIDACHARGIRVIVDGVYNHSDERSPLAQIDYTYWYYRDNPDEPDQRFGPKFDYEHFDENLNVWPAREYVRDAILFWIDRFHIDGVRFDATYLIRHYEFLGWLHDEIFMRIKGKPFYTIAENIPQDPSIAGPEGPLDAAWHENFSMQVMATVLGHEKDGRDPWNIDHLFDVLDPRRDGFSGAFNVVNYLDNHDQDRVIWQLDQSQVTSDAALRRVRLGAGLLLTSPGAPMIWMGQEFGENAPKSMDWQRINWTLLADPAHKALWDAYQKLITLRVATTTLQSNTFEGIWADHDLGVIAYKRWDESGGVVVVVANLHDEDVEGITIGNWPGDGEWCDHLTDGQITVAEEKVTLTLLPSDIRVYLRI